MKRRWFIPIVRKVFLVWIVLAAFFRCSDDEVLPTKTQKQSDPALSPEDDIGTYATSVSCSTCTYVVPANSYLIDGKTLNLKPGAVICLNAAIAYKNLLFRNIVGTASQPIIIQSCGGTVNVDGTGVPYGIKTENSKYFRITGGTTNGAYNIRVNGGQIGVTLDNLSTNFEVDHVQVMNSGFAGIMAKTDPSCDNATIRGNFTMTDVSFHDNYVHETGGEGFYIGNSFFDSGVSTPCGQRYPHEVHNVSIYNNLVKNSGWESIQVGSATQGAKIYNNTIENYGHANQPDQNNGIQIGVGTGGLCYGNMIKGGSGNGMIVLGLGDNIVHDNIITNAGNAGIFCDERYTPGPGFKFINNTIINPKTDGIRLYADLVPMNVVVNNIIVNPGSYSTYTAPHTGNDAYLYKLSSNVKVQVANNFFTRDINAVKFADAAASNFRQTASSPTVNKGVSITTYNIPKDFYNVTRLKGSAYDIGASEY